jgi:hypothetical protein
VTVAIVGLDDPAARPRTIFSANGEGQATATDVGFINAYLVPGAEVVVERASKPLADLPEMIKGNQPTDGGFLLLSRDEVEDLALPPDLRARLIRRIYGSQEFINGIERYCLWIADDDLETVFEHEGLAGRVNAVAAVRLASPKAATVAMADFGHHFGETRQAGNENVIIASSVSSESREYLPTGYAPGGTIITNLVFGLLNAPLWNMALIASRLHLVWIATVCGKLKTDFRYSNTLGWNTFPVPPLTDTNKADLTRAAEDILLAREAHFPATIADLYEPDAMPQNLREAHERNDEILERIYIGRRFKNDTERLEKLFEMYTKMVGKGKAA